MSDFALTPAQHAAVYTRGRSVLVSAAAGSGKTKVLTERLMAYLTDPDDPKDIDSFLIITFTRAAAAELRSRIMGELGKRLAEDPGNRRLQRQSNLCYRARICTIDSFCCDLLRENCHLLGLSPDFTVLEADRTDVLKQRALERVLEKAYADISRQSGFADLADTVGAGRDDRRLVEIIMSVYEQTQSHAYPEKWMEEQRSLLDISGISDAGETVWGRYLIERAHDTALYWANALDCLLTDISSADDICRAYAGSISESAGALRRLISASKDGWDALRGALPIPFPRLGALRGSSDPELSDHVKAVRDACKKAIGELEEQFVSPSDAALSDILAVKPSMEALLDITAEFSREYAAEKMRAGGLDFSDAEHFAVRLLADPETGKPTRLAAGLSERFTEIMVDEYQDVNAVQDLLFTSVSRGGNNMFLVGDIKQSIYRFRLADPTIFLSKYLSYKDIGDAGDSEPVRILLSQNFRSRASVLGAVNHVFENVMSTKLGELDYDDSAHLICGACYPEEGERKVELCVIDASSDEDESVNRTELEAGLIARRIKALVSGGTMISDSGSMHPAGYGDIVILMRAPNSCGGIYRRVLANAGIPVLAQQGGGFFETAEIQTVTNLLAVIDNPHQDIPLTSVLSSPIYGFTPDDLSAVRASEKDCDFFDALTCAAKNDEKCAKFLDELAEMRSISAEMPTDVFLRHIYGRLHLPSRFSVMPGGEIRKSNLDRLFECARKFESGGYRGLFRFVTWLRRMAENGQEPELGAPSRSGAVRIMSIHQSKGLEFPIVFLADTARRFNRLSLRSTVLVHPELGLGPTLTDAARGLEYPTAARSAVAAKLDTEGLSEEMRLLYVAMTRAKERLFISCAVSDAEKTIAKLRGSLSSPLSPEILAGAMSPAHWLIHTALLDDSPILLDVVSPHAVRDIPSAPAAPEDETDVPEDEYLGDLGRMLDFVYPYSAAVTLPSKITATEIKRIEDTYADPDSVSVAGMPPSVFRSAAHISLTGAEKGTATHILLQHIDLAKTLSEADVRAELAQLVGKGFMTSQQADAVNAADIVGFFRSEAGRLLLSADRLRREFSFSLLCPADRWFDSPEGEQVLLQGVIDCLIEKDGQLIILDYKTDRISRDEVSGRAAHYAPQVRTYAEAAERITGLKVSRGILYFLHCGVTAEISLKRQ